MTQMDLTKLTTEEKLEALRLLEHQELIDKEKCLEKVKLHDRQLKFHVSPARIRMFCGGNASGKTFTILHELVHTHLKTHPYRPVDEINHTWFIVSDFKKVPDYIRELRKVCPPSQFPEEDRLGSPSIRKLKWKDGGTTTFYSHEQDPMILEGMSFDALWIDEPPPRGLYIAAYRGLRNNPQHFVVMALTPISEPWLYTDIYQPGINGENKNIEVFVSTVYENSHNLSAEWLKQFEGSLSEEEKRVRLYGEFASLQGRVFKEFSRATNVVRTKPWPSDWPVWVCIDPHSRKPSTAVWAGMTKDDELVILEEASAEGIQELGELINRLEERHKWRVVSRIIDNSGSARDWSGSTAIDILRTKCNLSFRPVSNEEKNVEEGIFRIKSLLRPEITNNGTKEPKLFIMENCRKVIQDFELYGWKDSRHPEKSGVSEAPKKINDDFIDPVRYIVMQRPKHRWSYDTISYARGYTKSSKQKSIWDKLTGN